MDTIDLFEVEQLEDFNKEFVRFVHKKRFFHLPDQIKELVNDLKQGNFNGTITHRIDEDNVNVYKLRLPNPDSNAGTSNGYRVIYLVAKDNHAVFLLSIYYKKEIPKLSDKYLKMLIESCLFSLREPDEIVTDENPSL